MCSESGRKPENLDQTHTGTVRTSSCILLQDESCGDFCQWEKDVGDGLPRGTYSHYTVRSLLAVCAVMFCVPPPRHFGFDRGKLNCHRVHNKWTVEQPQAHSVVSCTLLNSWLFWAFGFFVFFSHMQTHTNNMCESFVFLWGFQWQNTLSWVELFGGPAVN